MVNLGQISSVEIKIGFIKAALDYWSLSNLARIKNPFRKIEAASFIRICVLIPGCHALLIEPHVKIDEKVIEAAGTQLKVIATISAGYNHIDLELCKRNGIKVGYAADVLSDDVADLAICLTIMTLRKVKQNMT